MIDPRALATATLSDLTLRSDLAAVLARTVLSLLDGECLGTVGFLACGEGGNYCSAACVLRAENARLQRDLELANKIVGADEHAMQGAVDDLRAENASLRDAAHRTRADLLDAQSAADQLRRDYLTVVDAIAPETGSAEHAAQVARRTRQDLEWSVACVKAALESQERLAEQLAAVTRERDVARVDLDQANRVAHALRATRDEIVKCSVEEALEEERRSERARGPR